MDELACLARMQGMEANAQQRQADQIEELLSLCDR